MVILRVDDKDIRSRLSKPQGKVLKYFDEALIEAKRARGKNIPVFSVGDRTTINFISNGFIPDVSVIDGKEMRKEAPLIKEEFFKRVFKVKNPRGTINTEITSVIRKSLLSPPSLIKVEGEEDLIALLILATTSTEAVVFYGQPKRGVVMITLTNKEKKRFKRLFKEILELNK